MLRTMGKSISRHISFLVIFRLGQVKKKNRLASPPDSARLNYFFIFIVFLLKCFNTILRQQNLVEV